MYEFISHYKCKHCGNTDCLFKVRRDGYLYKKTGNIRYKSTSVCKLCYLDSCIAKNYRSYSKNRDKLLLDQAIERIIHKELYNKRARKYYWKKRHSILIKKRAKYVPREKKGLIAESIRRSSLLSRVYLKEIK